MKRSGTVAFFAWLALLLAAACTGPDQSASDRGQATGSAVLQLAEVPPDVQCIVITVQSPGGQISERTFSATPGQATELPLNQLPLGETTFSGAAYASPCNAVSDASVASWIAAPVTATVTGSGPVQVTLIFRQTGSALVCGDFVPFGADASGCDAGPGPECSGTPGQWEGCRGSGCSVCSELVAHYPLYFANHPDCTANDTCAGEYFLCNEKCPTPTECDRGPNCCAGTPGQWEGCRGSGCSVCSELVADYPHYFDNHPACLPNDTCAGEYFLCNESCPAPTDADR